MYYEIRVNRHISEDWSDWLGALTIRSDSNGQGVLYGTLPDQTALLGVLNRLHGLNLTLLAVLSAESPPVER